MAKMCPLDGCHDRKGLCVHEKLMIGMGVLAMLTLVLYFSLGA